MPQARPAAARKKAVEQAPQKAGSINVQNEILEIWRGLLELDEIDINANFFDIGGYSILAVRLQGILSKKYGRRIPISELFRYPTISGLSGFVESFSVAEEPEKNQFADGAVSRAAKRRARYRN